MSYTQGRFDRNEILGMEQELVGALGSYLHPPTAESFCLMLLGRLPSVSSSMVETCQFMIELAACGETSWVQCIVC